MHLSKLLVMIIVTLTLLSFSMETVGVEDNYESRVDTSFEIEFTTGTEFNVDITMDVYRLTTDRTYNAIEIKSASDQEMGALRYELFLLLKSQIEVIFENADILNFTMPIFNGENFNEVLTVKLTPSFFNLSENINLDVLINGVLDMGAVVTYNFNLQAEPGWNNTFKYILPETMTLDFANSPEFDIHKNEITWTLSNWNGEKPNELSILSTRFKEPTTSELVSENITLEFELDTREIKTTNLKTNILTKAVDISGYNILPNFITNLDFVPADGIRLLIENGFITWEDLYQGTIRPVEETAISKIESSSFNQTLDVVFSWDSESSINCSNPYNITHMDNNPPIKAILTDNDVSLLICGVSPRALYGLVYAGGKANITQDDVNFGDKLDEIGYPYKGYLYLPNNIRLSGKNPFSWNYSGYISGEAESDIAPPYTNEKIDVIVEIDIRSTDLNLLSFFTGQTELNLGLFLQEKRNYTVTNLPGEFSLPPKISLNYLNSDAFRLCVEENVFTEEELTTFLNNEKQLFKTRLINILPGLEVNPRSNKDVFDESLAWDGDVASMDDFSPVIVLSYAHSSYPISFGLSFIPPGFEINDQSFNVTSIQNQNVVYRVLFPQGTSVEVNDSLDRAVVKVTDDGREYIEIKFDASESSLTDVVKCKIIPSVLFVLGVFIPCILSFIITIILVIIFYVIRKKRKRGKVVVVDEERYEGEDYYVPPPPSSK